MFSYYLEFKSECTVWKKASLPIARLEIKKLSCHCKEGRQDCLVLYMNTENILQKHSQKSENFVPNRIFYIVGIFRLV